MSKFVLILSLLLIIVMMSSNNSNVMAAAAADFNSQVDITWGGGRAKMSADGSLLQLSLDRGSGSGFRSRSQYLFGRFDMDIKLVPGNSAGTVTTYYLSSQGPAHDEVDLEFLGNSTGEPYVLHTNVFSRGKGNREQQFYLWFDPQTQFHTYSILWNPNSILFYVDGTPIRAFRNAESHGVPYPKSQPMHLYASLWDAEDWATRGGLVKTDWTKAPFVASYRNFRADACTAGTTCSASSSKWFDQSLSPSEVQKMKWVQEKYMIYDYCKDTARFPQGFPPECTY